MKNIYIYLLIVSGFAFNTALAQVPGYRGKRTLFTANIAPAMVLPVNFETGTNISYNFKIAPRVGFTLEHVYNRKRSIGLNYAYNAFEDKVGRYKTFFASPGSSVVYGTIDGSSPVKLKQHRLGLVLLKGTSGDLPAPLGSHFGFDLGVDIMSLYDTKGNLEYPDSTFSKGKYNSLLKPHVYFIYGYRRALSKSVLLSMQFELNLYYIVNAYSTALAGSDYMPEGESFAGQEQYTLNKDLLRKYQLLSNFTTITLQLSFLAF